MADEIIEKTYEAIEVAKATGKIKKGGNEATKSLEKGEAKLIAIAKDVSPPEITMHIPLLSKEKGILCVEVPSKEELGAAAGLSVSTTAVAIVKEGEAKAIIQALTKE
jgi:large subunit ribosomal protein L7Ae